MIYSNQPIVMLYQTYKKYAGIGPTWIIDSVIYHNINTSKYNPELVAAISIYQKN